MENILEIQVTRKDLKQPYDKPLTCPIATAIKRDYHGHVVVFGGSVRINNIHYNLRPEDDRKAYMRGDGKLLGRLLGGFKVILHKQHWT